MTRTLFFIIAATLIITSCASDPLYPKQKMWAHRVNDTITLQQKELLFDGIETDIYYSSSSNEIFVCHNDEDTINGLTLNMWFDALKEPQNHYYWLDVKNLTYQNADLIAEQILKITQKHNIKNKIFVESYNTYALKKVKRNDFRTLLWVENLNWKDIDTSTWYAITKKAIDSVQPNAISCEYGMFPLLCDTFPDIDVHFWHTPANESTENITFTKEMCDKKNVKVVLVDYEKPY